MANDTTNENLENNPLENESLDEDNVNIDDIEGLEKDITSSSDNEEESAQEEKKEILYDDGPRLEDRLQAIEDSIEKKPPVQNIPEEEQYVEGTELPTKESTTQDDDVEIVHHNENDENDNQLPQKQSLKEKLQDKKNLVKLLIAVLILLLMIITLIFIFLPGKKEQPVQAVMPEKPTEQTQQVQKPVVQKPTYEFKLDHINVTRVNKQLEKLTKYELLGMSEEEYLRQEKLKAEQKAKEEAERLEKERLAKEEAEQKAKEEVERLEKERLAKEEAEQKAKEEAEKLAAQEASQNGQTQQEQTNTSNTQNDATSQQNSEKNATIQGNTFLKFVHVPTYKKTLFKTELAKIKDIDARINPCRNTKNFIEIFIGPLDNNEQYSDIVNALQQKANYKNITMLELTKDEFETRCMVY
ncbi:hypothetical protein [Candidatus Marinarcus aquaticus]|uniref:Uncharacterized protein n=1 Tax=Candidatus Marinarcus aquaticus TaxID=2044504 RepID=A0A4Q0XRX4_9BACT|nr:hypothetical protein [Candidatus Marinarcus aquaticus]RXJ56243.1 hypothetical protein CRV04_09360 [Candidatus Marinarcus aquaticus]